MVQIQLWRDRQLTLVFAFGAGGRRMENASTLVSAESSIPGADDGEHRNGHPGGDHGFLTHRDEEYPFRQRRATEPPSEIYRARSIDVHRRTPTRSNLLLEMGGG